MKITRIGHIYMIHGEKRLPTNPSGRVSQYNYEKKKKRKTKMVNRTVRKSDNFAG